MSGCFSILFSVLELERSRNDNCHSSTSSTLLYSNTSCIEESPLKLVITFHNWVTSTRFPRGRTGRTQPAAPMPQSQVVNRHRSLLFKNSRLPHKKRQEMGGKLHAFWEGPATLMKTWKLFHIIIIIYVDFLRLTRLLEKRNHVLLKLHLLMTAKARCTVRSTWLWQRRAAIFKEGLSSLLHIVANCPSRHVCLAYVTVVHYHSQVDTLEPDDSFMVRTCTYQMLNSNHRCQCYWKLKTLPLYSSPLVYQHCSQLKLTCYCIIYIYCPLRKIFANATRSISMYVQVHMLYMHLSIYIYICFTPCITHILRGTI